jgi:hypothetical protein
MNDPGLEEFARRSKVFRENQQRFPPEALVPYYGQCIAWAPDGASIVAHADDFETLDERVRAAGFDPSCCVYASVDDMPTL